MVGHGSDVEGSWLVTAAVDGRSGVEARWKAEPTVAAAAIGRGLRLLHDLGSLGVADRWAVA